MTVLSRPVLIAIVSLSLSSGVFADKVIKSVDDSGNVSYSDRPTADSVSSEQVPLEPAPSGADVKQAQDRLERTKQLNKELEGSRKELAQDREKAKATAKPAASEPAPVVVEESSGYYPSYRKPLEPGLPGKPPGSKGDHPAYAPGARPPIARPLPSRN